MNYSKSNILPVLTVFVIMLGASFVLPGTFGVSPTSNGNPNAGSSSYFPLSYVNSDIKEILNISESNNLNFEFSDSVSTFETLSLSAFNSIANNSGFQVALANYSNYVSLYFTQGMTYNFSSQNWGTYLMINLPTEFYQKTLTFAYSSANGTVFGPSISSTPNVLYSTSYTSDNWAGYEFYESGKPAFAETSSVVNIPTISMPNPVPYYDFNYGMAGWIGMSPYFGGINQYNQTVIAQSGFSRIFYWDGWTQGWNWGNYTIWYQTREGGSSAAYRGFYPGIGSPTSGWITHFGINDNTGSKSVTYSVLIENTGASSVVTTPYDFSSNPYVEYIVEAPRAGGPPPDGVNWIAKFSPTVRFNDSSLTDINGYNPILDTMYSAGNYLEDIMIQQATQNIADAFITTQWGGEPAMTYITSN